MGSGGRKASLAAMRPGHGGQQKRQQSSLRERPFILHCAGGEDKRITVTPQHPSVKNNDILITMLCIKASSHNDGNVARKA